MSLMAMHVHHFAGATLCPVSARLVNGAGGVFSRGRMVCHCWLVESDDGLILVDTGLGAADLADVTGRLGRGFGWLLGPTLDVGGTAREQVSALGFDPSDVRHVIPTHLDVDHAGGLPDFPDARVHVLRPEYEAAMNRSSPRDRHRYRPAHWEHEPRWEVHEPDGEPWFGFEGVRPLGPTDDVLLVPLFGHTRGHCGVAVRTESGWKLHAGDAYFFHGEMDEPPRCTPGLSLFQRLIAADNKSRKQNQARLRELASRHSSEVKVHSAHCPVELERFATAR